MASSKGENKKEKNSFDLSPSLEDYLEEIYRFSLTQPIVRVSEISHKLNVAQPSVTKALRRLKLKEYITYQRYGLIGLTDKGKRIGSFLVKRNQILQEFLLLLSAQCNVSEEAEAMEHYLSVSTIDVIQTFVAFMRQNPLIHEQLTAFILSQQEVQSE
ncbi:DtxR family iron (metal) dependent repressor [Anaerospora hongkongensis]|uniref:DtxR family iron (Metal) dependent repressor n=1 Tax=Anaerospora hongkongensis TaxID=244830 RepID=A0A4R1PTC5_9FIRM|nr:iron dependent repressor, metal binding and dimerization domain protein [Anaerospora hongkongensis]TCL35014.1 DtxR family iron (metal) dependent repressor [Anaerospora hongkongensis]